MVAMCRPILADPHLPKKMIEGRFDEIRQCMGCNWCLDRLFNQVGCECPMNPAYSWEKEYELLPARDPKNVMIIGGGVSGMQAAYAAAKRGHKVTLYEKSDKLGGQLKVAAAFPRLYTRELWNLPKWLINEINKLDVKVILETEVTRELVEKENPDVIVVATGAVEKKLSVPVENGANVVYLWEYLNGTAAIGQKVVVVGGDEAVEAAVSLAREGKEVTMLQEGDTISWAHYLYAGSMRREPLMRYLKDGNVNIKYNCTVKAVSKDGLTVTGPEGDETLQADTVLIALGRVADNALYDELNERGKAIYLIGDAKEVRNMTPASHEGYWVGRHI